MPIVVKVISMLLKIHQQTVIALPADDYFFINLSFTFLDEAKRTPLERK